MKITETHRKGTSAFLFGLSAGRILEMLPIQWSIFFFGSAILLWLFDFLNDKKSRRYRTKAMAIIGACFGLIIWLLPTIDNRVFFIERYAAEWGGKPSSQARIKDVVLKNNFITGKDYRITPAVENQFPDSFVDGVVVFLDIPNNIQVKNSVGQETYWRISTGRRFFAPIVGGISSGHYNSVYEPLWINFPGPGKYRIHYHASGEIKRGGTNGFNLDGWIRFEMAK